MATQWIPDTGNVDQLAATLQQSISKTDFAGDEMGQNQFLTSLTVAKHLKSAVLVCLRRLRARKLVLLLQ